MARTLGQQLVLVGGVLMGLANPCLFAGEVPRERAEETVEALPIDLPPLTEFQKRSGLGPWHNPAQDRSAEPTSDSAGSPSPGGPHLTGDGVQPAEIPAEDIDLTGQDLTIRECLSVGPADRGRLVNGVRLPVYPGLVVKTSPELTYGTPETIAAIHYAVARVRETFPNSHDLVVGDISRMSGGRLPPHRSHQSGRDVDIGYYYTGTPPRHFIDTNSRNLDVARTWALLEAFLEDNKVDYVFMDYSVQRLLYNYVKYELGAPESYLSLVFSYPSHARSAFVRHAPRHRDHIHVRLVSPIAVAAGRGIDLDADEDGTLDATLLASFQRLTYIPRATFGTVEWGDPPQTEVVKEWQKVYVTYRIRSGDNLSSIARKYHCSVAELTGANHLKSTSTLHVGQTLRIPQRQLVDVEVPVDTAVAAASPEEKATPAPTPSSSPLWTSPRTATRWEKYTLSYRVRPGDYPGVIASRYGVSVETLLKANGLAASTRIYPGQTLKIPQSRKVVIAPAPVVARAPESAGEGPVLASASPQAARSSVARSGVAEHLVAPGEFPGLIAQKYHMSVDELLSLNGLTAKTRIYPGQRLKVASNSSAAADVTAGLEAPAGDATEDRGCESVASSAPLGEGTDGQVSSIRRTCWVTVAPGDNLWALARKHNTSVDVLCELNGLASSTTLQVGQRLKVRVWYEKVPVIPPSAPASSTAPGGCEG